ncbi:MAG: PDZ domain-containing protein [Oscillospiraceae bacterium]|nr:PDZ domain-containing protein [Oscillospiraceae bacterium]
MNKKISLGIAVGIAILASALTFVITYNYAMNIFNKTVKSVTEKEESYTKLAEMDQYVRANYTGELDEVYLMNCIMEGYITGISDSNAEYYPPDKYADALMDEEGVTEGLGFTWEKEASGYIKLLSVNEDSSAGEMGLVPGDIITAVNNTDVIAYAGGYDEASSLLDCVEGTKVKLHIKRANIEGVSEFFAVDVVSRRSEIRSVSCVLMDNVGYIKVSTFNGKTPEQFRTAVNSMLEEGAQALVFDVRDNSQGTAAALQGCLDCIIGDAEIAVAHFKSKDEVIVKTTEAEKIAMPMSVIINGNTASMAELFAIAMRDEAGAHIVGIQSKGNGVLQHTYKLTGGAAVKIPVAVISTSKSGEFNGAGVKPDFEIAIPDGEILVLDHNVFSGQDTQLAKAIEVVQPAKKDETEAAETQAVTE